MTGALDAFVITIPSDEKPPSKVVVFAQKKSSPLGSGNISVGTSQLDKNAITNAPLKDGNVYEYHPDRTNFTTSRILLLGSVGLCACLLLWVRNFLSADRISDVHPLTLAHRRISNAFSGVRFGTGLLSLEPFW